jgi:hypothetical protein
MKKYLLFISAVSLISTLSLAQSFVVTPHENPVDGEILNDYTELVTEITVENISENSLEVMASRQVINGLQGTTNYFCWTACYLPSTNVSTSPTSFDAGEINENLFSVHYSPNNTLGSVTIKYCVFDNNNPSDSACTNVTFNALTTSVDDEFFTNGFSEFYPNPTTNTARINFSLLSADLETKIVLTDMLGNTIVERQISEQNGTLNFDLSSVKSGLYFANIFVGNELKTIKRLVVTK